MDEAFSKAFGEKVVQGLLQKIQDSGITRDEFHGRVEAMIARRSSPEGIAEAARANEAFEQERKDKEGERIAKKERLKQEWEITHSYRWMMAPVPMWCEDEEGEESEKGGEVVLMPMTNSIAEVEAIRACAREWEAGDKSRRLHSHLFDYLGHFNMDWENIVRRENGLRAEFVNGIEFKEKDEAYNL